MVVTRRLLKATPICTSKIGVRPRPSPNEFHRTHPAMSFRPINEYLMRSFSEMFDASRMFQRALNSLFQRVQSPNVHRNGIDNERLKNIASKLEELATLRLAKIASEKWLRFKILERVRHSLFASLQIPRIPEKIQQFTNFVEKFRQVGSAHDPLCVDAETRLHASWTFNRLHNLICELLHLGFCGTRP